jgi:hypothetical protein
MALSKTDKTEIERMVRKEIKDFMDSNTLKQFEDKMIKLIQQEIKRGKLSGDINDIVVKIMREFYQIMWTRRSFWEPTLKNVR